MYNYSKLPEHIRGGVQRYIEEGIPPGDFLKAVICNNLKESFARADDINISRMFDIVEFFYNEVPGICWGSELDYKQWLNICYLRKTLKPGTQIIYQPKHVKTLDHPDCEKGFVTSIAPDRLSAFCRYWNYDGSDLRTKANSEATWLNDLIIENTHPQKKVDEWIKKINEEKK